MVVGEHRIQTFEVVIVLLLWLLSFDTFVLTSAHPLSCPNILKRQLIACSQDSFTIFAQ